MQHFFLEKDRVITPDMLDEHIAQIVNDHLKQFSVSSRLKSAIIGMRSADANCTM